MSYKSDYREGSVLEETVPVYNVEGDYLVNTKGKPSMKDRDIDYKYNERNLIEELKRYVDQTYSEHYSKSKIQTTEVVIDNGHGIGFTIGNVLKYSQRYGIKGNVDDHRKDLLKVLHYALIALYVHDKNNEVNDGAS